MTLIWRECFPRSIHTSWQHAFYCVQNDIPGHCLNMFFYCIQTNMPVHHPSMLFIAFKHTCRYIIATCFFLFYSNPHARTSSQHPFCCITSNYSECEADFSSDAVSAVKGSINVWETCQFTVINETCILFLILLWPFSWTITSIVIQYRAPRHKLLDPIW